MRRHNDTVDSRHHPVDDGQRRWLVADDALLGCGAVARRGDIEAALF